jgi:hypothetical protein
MVERLEMVNPESVEKKYDDSIIQNLSAGINKI